ALGGATVEESQRPVIHAVATEAVEPVCADVSARATVDGIDGDVRALHPAEVWLAAQRAQSTVAAEGPVGCSVAVGQPDVSHETFVASVRRVGGIGTVPRRAVGRLGL